MRMGVPLRQFAAAWKRRAPARWNVGVLGHVERGKAALFEGSREFGDVDPVIGREIEDAYAHDPSLRPVDVG